MLQDIFHKIFPEETDHGKMNFGDYTVLLLDLGLLLYTGWRSWDLLSRSVPDGWMVLAIAGLFGLDIGLVLWSLAWIYGSTTREQDWITGAMWLMDAVGVVLTGLADSLLYSPQGTLADGLRATLMTVAWFGVPIIVAVNMLMGLVYHIFVSPQAHLRRMERRKRFELEKLRQDFEINRRIEEEQADFAREALLQRQGLVEAYRQLAALAVQVKRERAAILSQLRAVSDAPGGHAPTTDTDLLRTLLGMGTEEEKSEGRATPVAAPVPQEVRPGGNNHHPHPDFTTNSDFTGLDVGDEG